MKISIYLILEVTLAVETDVMTTKEWNPGEKELIVRKHVSTRTGYDYQTRWTEYCKISSDGES